jgi:hypothetical protein
VAGGPQDVPHMVRGRRQPAGNPPGGPARLRAALDAAGAREGGRAARRGLEGRRGAGARGGAWRRPRLGFEPRRPVFGALPSRSHPNHPPVRPCPFAPASQQGRAALSSPGGACNRRARRRQPPLFWAAGAGGPHVSLARQPRSCPPALRGRRLPHENARGTRPGARARHVKRPSNCRTSRRLHSTQRAPRAADASVDASLHFPRFCIAL